MKSNAQPDPSDDSSANARQRITGQLAARGPLPTLEEPGDLWTIDDLSSWSGLGKSTLYEAARSGWLAPIVIRWGRSIRIPKAALRRLIESEDQ
jgi:hypothetical protein